MNWPPGRQNFLNIETHDVQPKNEKWLEYSHETVSKPSKKGENSEPPTF